jgi:hypothetical protein
MTQLEEFMEIEGGITSVPNLARHFGVSHSELRDACASAGVKRIGAAFCIDLSTAEALAEQFGDEDADDENEDLEELDDDEDEDLEE